MPIMAAHDQNDARGSARVLATTVRKCIEEDYNPSRHKSALNNLYRLLEAYRAHRFGGFDYEPRSARGPEALTLLPPAEQNVVELRMALDQAFDNVYNGRVDEAVDSIENVLRSIAYPKMTRAPIESVDRERVSAFLKSFIENLYRVR
jgi:hypothetical protein